MTKNKAFDEVLEFIWSQREVGSSSITELLKIDEVAEEADMNTLRQMMSDGLVNIAATPSPSQRRAKDWPKAR